MDLDLELPRVDVVTEGDVNISERQIVMAVWAAGLVGALVLTLVILKEVSLTLRALLQIRKLAQVTRDAAWGIAKNVKPIAKLPGAAPPLQKIATQSARLAAAAEAIEGKVKGLAQVKA